MASDPPDSDVDPTLHTLNTGALVGLVVSVGVGVGGLFVLPLLRSVFGLGFGVAFGLVLAIELVALLGVVASIFRLHQQRTFD